MMKINSTKTKILGKFAFFSKNMVASMTLPTFCDFGLVSLQREYSMLRFVGTHAV